MASTTASSPHLSTPMLRSQTSAILVPTWVTNSTNTVFKNSPSLSPAANSTNVPIMQGAGCASSSNTNPSSSSTGRAGRSSALSAGLASWRTSGSSTISPGTSPSLGPSAAPPGAPPPLHSAPPPSYSATVGSASTTSASKKAVVFCEISDHIYNRMNNPELLEKERKGGENTPPENSAGKYVHIIRIAGLEGEGTKEKVSSAVTIACQTQLSEPSGRFFVFELPPVNYELWPQQVASLHPTSTSSNSHENEISSNKKENKKSSSPPQQQQQQQELPPDMDLPPSCDNYQTSRLVCVLCPDSELAEIMKGKLQNVFAGNKKKQENENEGERFERFELNNENQPKQNQTSSVENETGGISVDIIQRTLPVSCCLVVKASNSANKHNEAETVPWSDLMEAGAVCPSDINNNNTNNNNAEKEKETKQETTTSTTSTTSTTTTTNTNTGAPPPPPSYDEHVRTTSPQMGSTALPPVALPIASTSTTSHLIDRSYHTNGISAPFTPSYFRLLRNERGVFRNALFLRFPSQIKAELSMMYLERICLVGRRIRVEHKKQSRSFTSLVSQSTTSNTTSAGTSPQQQVQQQHQQSTTINNSSFGVTMMTPATAAATNVEAGTSATHPTTNIQMMDLNVSELVRRFDRDGFSYPKRLLSKEDIKYLTELTSAHELTLDIGQTQVTVTRPRKGASSGSGAGSGGRNSNSVSPALTAQTPQWAPQTPPLAPSSNQKNSSSSPSPSGETNTNQLPPAALANGSFSANSAAGGLTFRGLRHWKEQREKQNADDKQNSSNTNKEKEDLLSSSPPPMALDNGAAHSKYIRTLDPPEAMRKGIAAFSAGRGRPVSVSQSSE